MGEREVTRVLLVDDDALVRSGLAMILGSAPDLEVVGEAADGAAAVMQARALAPDVVVMDIRMPVLDGIAATERIMALPDPPRILVITTFHLEQNVFDALEAGASGFLLKDTPPAELIEAVRVVASGEAMLSPAHTRAVIDRFAAAGLDSRRSRASADLEGLSGRELEVARLVADGLSNAEIAERLFCSEATVKSHLTHTFTKLGFTNRVRLAILVHDAER